MACSAPTQKRSRVQWLTIARTGNLLGAAKCAQLSGELAGLQGEAVKQVEALKEGLARELRKQKVGRPLGAGQGWGRGGAGGGMAVACAETSYILRGAYVSQLAEEA